MSNKALKRALRAHVSRRIGGRAAEYQGLIDAQGGTRAVQDGLDAAQDGLTDIIRSLTQEYEDSDPGSDRARKIKSTIQQTGALRNEIVAVNRKVNAISREIGSIPKI